MRRFVRTAAPIPVAVFFGSTTGCSFGPPENLRGPTREVGQVYHTEMKLTMTDGTITVMAGGGVSESGRIDITSRGEYEDEVRAVTGGRVTGLRTRFLAEQDTQTVRLGGQTDARTEDSPLAGETVDADLTDGAWKNRLVGKAPTDRQAADLATLPPPQSSADWYPDGKVRRGHAWEVDARQLSRLFGTGLRIDAGSWRLTFEKAVTVDGARCARIAEAIDVTGRMRDDRGESVAFSLEVTGTSLRSLEGGFDLSTCLTGTMTMTGTVSEGGRESEVTIRGPVAVESKTRRK